MDFHPPPEAAQAAADIQADHPHIRVSASDLGAAIVAHVNERCQHCGEQLGRPRGGPGGMPWGYHPCGMVGVNPVKSKHVRFRGVDPADIPARMWAAVFDLNDKLTEART